MAASCAIASVVLEVRSSPVPISPMSLRRLAVARLDHLLRRCGLFRIVGWPALGGAPEPGQSGLLETGGRL